MIKNLLSWLKLVPLWSDQFLFCYSLVSNLYVFQLSEAGALFKSCLSFYFLENFLEFIFLQNYLCQNHLINTNKRISSFRLHLKKKSRQVETSSIGENESNTRKTQNLNHIFPGRYIYRYYFKILMLFRGG